MDTSPTQRLRRIGAQVRDPTVAWTIAATVLAAVLWTRSLNAPLFIDEGASWYLAYQPTWGGFWDLLKQQEVAPPPFYVGLRFIVHDLGHDSHTAMRLPVVLATLPSVPLGALLARRIGAGTFGVAAAAGLLALSPLMLEYAQQVRAYGPAMTITLLAALLVVIADQKQWGARWAWAAAAALAVGPWIHYIAAAPLAVLGLYTLLRTRSRQRVALGVFIGVVWLGAAAFARTQYDAAGAGVDEFVDLRWIDLRHVFATAWDGRYRGATWLLIVGVAALVVACAALRWARGPARLVLLAGMAGPVAIVVLSALGPDITLSRYLAPAAPLIVVGLAATLSTAVSGRVFLVVLAACGAIGVARSLDRDTGWYPDAESVVRSTLPQFQNGGGVLASSDYNTSFWLAIYTGQRAAIPGFETALGGPALVDAVCAKKRVRQLVPTLAGIPYQQNWYDAIGYTTRVVPTSDPGLRLIVADPTGRARCPKPGPPPPVT